MMPGRGRHQPRAADRRRRHPRRRDRLRLAVAGARLPVRHVHPRRGPVRRRRHRRPRRGRRARSRPCRLRTTRLRAVDGTVWHVPNGEIRRVGNMSPALVARAARHRGRLRHRHRARARGDQAASPTRSGTRTTDVLEEPELWGVEELGAQRRRASGSWSRRTPSKQWRVSRAAARAHQGRVRRARGSRSRSRSRPSGTRPPSCRRAEMGEAEDRISWFPVPDEADLPPELQGLFRAARERIGFVPNVFRTYAFRPERLSAWFAHFRMLHEATPGLSAAEREMIAVVVSMANGCLVLPGRARRRAARGVGRPGDGRPDHARLAPRRRAQRAPARDLRDGRAAHAASRSSATRRSSTSCAPTACPTRTRGTSSRSPRCTTSPTAWRWPPGSCRTPSTTRSRAEASNPRAGRPLGVDLDPAPRAVGVALRVPDRRRRSRAASRPRCPTRARAARGAPGGSSSVARHSRHAHAALVLEQLGGGPARRRRPTPRRARRAGRRPRTRSPRARRGRRLAAAR